VGAPSLVWFSFVPNFFTGYSPLDFTVLDPHYGTLQEWQSAIDQIHAHGMYFMADFTVGTMGDLIGTVGCVQVESYSTFCAYIF
jgi:glycosidase